MSQIIQQIQINIDEAAKSYGQKDAKELFTQMEEARCFRIGAAYLMPVIKYQRYAYIEALKLAFPKKAHLEKIKLIIKKYDELLLELLNKDEK